MEDKLVITLTIVLFTVFIFSPSNVNADWPMVAANPQRTSFTSEEVGATAAQWYRVIEPYIPPYIQPVMGATINYPNGLVFIATSKGLYVYRADTGVFVWKFITGLPLGNSPTFSNGVVYFGGFDRKLYARNADNGNEIWTFTGAKAGYDTNPLVVDGNVILGNRDGAIYAVNAATGQQVWKFQTAGPVRYSSAYKGGIVYTVSNDGYLYANNSSTGAKLWQSNTQMHGDGFYSYWPVVYTDSGATGKDYIIVGGSEGYRAFDRPGQNSLSCGGNQWCESTDEWNYAHAAGATYLGQVVASESWAAGRIEADFGNTMTKYLNAKPWRRFYFVFDATSGQEVTSPTYIPADPVLSNSGNIYPVIIGKDNLIYLGNHWFDNTQSLTVGWKFGTSKMVLQGLQQAGDEPMALSAGGNLIYRVVCCSRVATVASIIGGTNYMGNVFYSYNIDSVVPGYDAMWWGSSMSNMDRLFGSYGGLSTLLGGTKSVNGEYHEHGDQNPLIPYKGKVYTLKSNALIAFGPGTRTQLPIETYSSPAPSSPDLGIDLNELKSRLETEVQKVVTAGHLRPGYYNAGMFANSYPWMNDYFSTPGDTLLALSMAYPYLNSSLQAQVKTYLASEFADFNRINWTGAKREWLPLPPEVETDMQTAASEGQVDKYYIYALWKYAANVAPENKTAIINKANSIRSTSSALGSIRLNEAASNRNTAGDVGWAGLNGNSTAVSSCGWFNRDSEFGAVGGQDNLRSMNIARNFLFLTEELGECMSKNSAITGTLPEYEWLAPYWFVSRFEASSNESTMQHLYDPHAIFLAKAYIQKRPREELIKYLDVPGFRVGDMFYIQNLVATIEAPEGGQTATPTPILATSTPTPTPSADGKPGDANSDGKVDGLDYFIWRQNYNTQSTGAGRGDFNNNGFVDGLDYVIWLNNYGK